MECTKNPKLRGSVGRAPHGIAPAAPKFGGASTPGALDLLQLLKPDLEEVGASLAPSPRCLSRLGKRSLHARQNSPKWLKTRCYAGAPIFREIQETRFCVLDRGFATVPGQHPSDLTWNFLGLLHLPSDGRSAGLPNSPWNFASGSDGEEQPHVA